VDAGWGNETTVIVFMLAVVDGVAFQLPISRLSDRFDRRIVLATLGVSLAIIPVALVQLLHSYPILLTAAVILICVDPISGMRCPRP